jgi:hypothetical protein
LHLQRLTVQLEQTADGRGLLQHCTGLSALDLHGCEVPDARAAAAVIAALPQLRRLCMTAVTDSRRQLLKIPTLHPQGMAQLTHFSFQAQQQTSQLAHLSAVVNLECLELPELFTPSVSDKPRVSLSSMLSELVKLTRLHVGYECSMMDNDEKAQQLQHLSCLTALQELAIECNWSLNLNAAGIVRLSQLTHLRIKSEGEGDADAQLTTSTHSWSRLTALQSLPLEGCVVQPQALAACTQLRSLSLQQVRISRDASLHGLLGAVSQLSSLTSLDIERPGSFAGLDLVVSSSIAATAFTALTTSTNLRSLKLGFWDAHPWDDSSRFGRLWYVELFNPGTVYPRMTQLDLSEVAVSEQQLLQLCDSCPNLDTLQLSQCEAASAWEPLLKLSALTHLQVVIYPEGRAAAAELTRVAAQLAGLKEFEFVGAQRAARGPPLTDPALLPLTALTNLEKLWLACGSVPGRDGCYLVSDTQVDLRNQVCVCVSGSSGIQSTVSHVETPCYTLESTLESATLTLPVSSCFQLC